MALRTVMSKVQCTIKMVLTEAKLRPSLPLSDLTQRAHAIKPCPLEQLMPFSMVRDAIFRQRDLLVAGNIRRHCALEVCKITTLDEIMGYTAK